MTTDATPGALGSNAELGLRARSVMMFGLTKREQRWKAEQRAAETLAGLAAVAIRGVADARIAEAQVDADELSRLRSEVERLRSAASQASFCLRTLVPDDADAQMTVRLLNDALGRPNSSLREP